MAIRLPRTDHASLLSPTPHLLRALGAIATTSSIENFDVPESANSASLVHLDARVRRIPAKDFSMPVTVTFPVPFGKENVTRTVVDISGQGIAVALEPG